MSLRKLKTNLKSLKFGNDRFGDGGIGSGQPYIQTKIPKTEDDPTFDGRGTDSLLRGGIGAPLDASRDTLRLAKYFADLKSPSGILFVAKQNLLSRTAVATQASGKLDWKDSPLNGGIYTPLSTLIQASQNYLGGHVTKQGLNPFGGPLTGGLRTYKDVNNSVINNNRLVNLYNEHVGRFSSTTLLSYSGGPGSTLGAGKTFIPFATNNVGGITKVLDNDPINKSFIKNQTGLKNRETSGQNPVSNFISPWGASKEFVKIAGGINNKNFRIENFGNPNNAAQFLFYEGNPLDYIDSSGGLTWDNVMKNTTISPYTKPVIAAGSKVQKGQRKNPVNLFQTPLGVSTKYESLTTTGIAKLAALTTSSNFTWTPLFNPSVYQKDTLITDQKVAFSNNSLTFTQVDLEELVNSSIALNQSSPGSSIQDFRTPLLAGKKISTIMSRYNSYTDPNTIYEGTNSSRVNMSSPGQKGNKINYTKGKILQSGTPQEKVSIVDRINYLPIYKSSTNRLSTEDGINDFVKFRIAAILRNGEKVYSHFRAFINSFSDGYSAEWSGTKYMGRGEELYKYGGFGRKISLSYTVAAQSKPELMAQYKKLNFLASTLAPDYGDSGYMGGVLTTLTLGGWCYELPGFINSLSLEVPQDSPWDIAIGSVVEKGKGDRNVKEMPHICNVSMEYTPIHTFRPSLQDNTYDKGGDGEVATYGSERYLGLTQGSNNNYKSVSLAEAATPNSTQYAWGSGYKK